MKLPSPRGPLSSAVNDHLMRQDHRVPTMSGQPPSSFDEDDRALALWTLFELFYREFDGVDADLEWDTTLLGLRHQLEADLEAGLRRDFEEWDGPKTFEEMLEHDAGERGIADHVKENASVEDVLEILKQKSIYHLKEADPHCFVLPRLEAGPKAALAELQYDELGDGQPERVHSQLFADALDAAGLDSSYGAFIDHARTSTLTASNALSMFCLRRRLRYAAMGHLAAFEGTSSLPCADIVRGLRRLGVSERVVRYYDEHIEADAVHEQLAWHDICGPMGTGDPQLDQEIAFGAFTCLELEHRNAQEILEPMR